MKLKISKLLILSAFFLQFYPQLSLAKEPEQLIQNFQQKLLIAMKSAKNLSLQERYKLLEPTVMETFNLPMMARISVGKFWKNATKQNKEKLISSFTRMSISTLASLFRSYSGQSFKILEVMTVPREIKLVKTEMLRPKEKPIPITFVTKKYTKGWLVIDVIVDAGISELRVKRSEYRGILKNRGIGSLIKALNKKASELIEAETKK